MRYFDNKNDLTVILYLLTFLHCLFMERHPGSNRKSVLDMSIVQEIDYYSQHRYSNSKIMLADDTWTYTDLYRQ